MDERSVAGKQVLSVTPAARVANYFHTTGAVRLRQTRRHAGTCRSVPPAAATASLFQNHGTSQSSIVNHSTRWRSLVTMVVVMVVVVVVAFDFCLSREKSCDQSLSGVRSVHGLEKCSDI